MLMVCNSLVIAALLLLLVTPHCSVALTHEDDIAFVEDDVEKLSPRPAPSERASSECCTTGSAGFINKHYLLASTMDGKVTAMDINRNGEVVWTVDADKVPLLSSSLSSQQLMAGKLPYMLVPSLDGSLYMFNVKSSALSPVPLSTNIRIMIGDDEVAGGTFVTSTGVDPLTGKIRYRCTAGNCVQHDAPANDSSPYTLIMRKNTQIARAADPLTGAEKWNLSVGEYEVSLVSSDHSLRFESATAPTHVRFLLEPPNGAVSAVDSCGNLQWEKRLPSPIARVWQLSRGKIFEVSLFSSDIVGALSEFSGSGREFIPKYEAPFYFGTVNSAPYIIPSELLREEMRRAVAAKQTHYHPQTTALPYHQNVPFLEDLKVGDLIRGSYRTTVNAIEADPVNGAPNPASSKSLACNMYDVVTISGSRELQEVKSNNQAQGDRGWYIFKPFRRPCAKNNPFQGAQQKEDGSNKRCKRKNVFEELKQIAYEPVSGWWKIVALFLTLVATSLATVIGLYSHQIRRRRLLVLWHELRNGSRMHSNKSNSKVKHSNGDAAGILRNRRTTSTTTSQSTTQDPFSSKFLEDFVPVKWLGRGGYGVVFSCRNRLDDRSYAVKRIAVSNTTAAIDRVKREARAMAHLDHPGIIRYFHTWMEKPPSGWQQAKDKEILQKIRSIADSASDSIHTPESDLSGTQPRITPVKDLSVNDKVLLGINVNSLMEKDDGVSNSTDNLSWVCDGNDNGMGTSTVSTSSSSDSESGPGGPGITAIAAGSDDSLSVIFAHDESCRCANEKIEEKRSENSSSRHLFEPPAVLVTSMEDLQSCKKTRNYVYLYIQMELCQELTLHSWLRTNSTDEDREIGRMRKWLAELVCAIDYIHSQGLIHRDLKPQNIFFSADNYLKIGDLGLVTNYVSAEETSDCKQDVVNNISHTSNVGTRLYMSPEQLKGKSYNEKIDVFSLGLIFVELIVPFTTVMERNNILSGLQKGIIPKCLNSRSAEKEFIAWLTAVNPEHRPSARQVAECEYLHGEVQLLGTSYFREHTSSNSR